MKSSLYFFHTPDAIDGRLVSSTFGFVNHVIVIKTCNVDHLEYLAHFPLILHNNPIYI